MATEMTLLELAQKRALENLTNQELAKMKAEEARKESEARAAREKAERVERAAAFEKEQERIRARIDRIQIRTAEVVASVFDDFREIEALNAEWARVDLMRADALGTESRHDAMRALGAEQLRFAKAIRPAVVQHGQPDIHRVSAWFNPRSIL